MRRRGFTLIELLVVMAIILTLVALLAAGLGVAKEKAKSKASRALIGRVQSALENYFSEFRDYPPDGYDQEPGWTVGPNGVRVGSNPARDLKGTAALMYFLCRPLIKVTIMGDPNENDARNNVRTPVGPFLMLDGTNYSRGRGDEGSTDPLSRFDPGFTWSGTGNPVAFWDSPNLYRTVEIIDAYFRPLCYDKVKVNNSLYFQPDRFHQPGKGGGTDKGHKVHPDQTFLPTISCGDDEEMICPRNGGANHDLAVAGDEATRYQISCDPRFAPGQGAPDGCCSNTNPGTTTTHRPRNVGGYDLWSYGRSYTNPRDDITSWGE